MTWVPKRPHEPFLERGHEDAIRVPVSTISRGFSILRRCLKLLRDGAGLEEQLADFLEQEDGARSPGSVIVSPHQ